MAALPGIRLNPHLGKKLKNSFDVEMSHSIQFKSFQLNSVLLICHLITTTAASRCFIISTVIERKRQQSNNPYEQTPGDGVKEKLCFNRKKTRLREREAICRDRTRQGRL